MNPPLDRLRELVQRWRVFGNDFDVTRGDSEVEQAYFVCADELEAALAEVRGEGGAIDALLLAGIERGIGEHDMVRCRFCGQEGHNEEVGHHYGIKHADKCVWLAASRRAQGGGK